MRAAYTLLFLGDVVGRVGRETLLRRLPKLRQDHQPLFTVVNAENAAGGAGLTPALADEILGAGVDAITLGNHAFNKREIGPYLGGGKPVIRPVNFSGGVPGRGSVTLEKEGVRLMVTNLSGRHNMESWYDDPWAAADRLAEEAHDAGAHLFVDFHAESTSEKVAMGWYLDGRAIAVLGTHTHVQTADERVLPKGTAHMSDVGMCGPRDSVLGSDVAGVLERFRIPLPRKLEPAGGPGVICGAAVEVDLSTGRATRITRLRVGEE